MPRCARDSNPGPLSCEPSVLTTTLCGVCVCERERERDFNISIKEFHVKKTIVDERGRHNVDMLMMGQSVLWTIADWNGWHHCTPGYGQQAYGERCVHSSHHY